MPQPDLEALERDIRDLALRVSQIERQLGADMPAPAAAVAIDRPPAALLPERPRSCRRWAARFWGWPAPTCCVLSRNRTRCRPPPA